MCSETASEQQSIRMNAYLFAIIFNGAWFGGLCIHYRYDISILFRAALSGDRLALCCSLLLFIKFACCCVAHAEEIKTRRFDRRAKEAETHCKNITSETSEAQAIKKKKKKKDWRTKRCVKKKDPN